MRYLALVLLTLTVGGTVAADDCKPDIPNDLELGCVNGTYAVRSISAQQILLFKGTVCGRDA